MSKTFANILNDASKVKEVESNRDYKNSILPRLEKLAKLLPNVNELSDKDVKEHVDFVKTLIGTLIENPDQRLTTIEMKWCNELWKTYNNNWKEIDKFIKSDNIINAIKEYRNIHKCGLRDAKNAIENRKVKLLK